MEESRNIGRECPSRPYPFGTYVSPEVLYFRSGGVSEREERHQDVRYA
jgi:hypothetical protein